MEEPCILLYTKTQSGFRYTDSYEGVSITDLKTLLRQGREAIALLKGELIKRQHGRASDQPGKLGKYYERFYNTAWEINIIEYIDSRAAKQIDDTVETLNII